MHKLTLIIFSLFLAVNIYSAFAASGGISGGGGNSTENTTVVAQGSDINYALSHIKALLQSRLQFLYSELEKNNGDLHPHYETLEKLLITEKAFFKIKFIVQEGACHESIENAICMSSSEVLKQNYNVELVTQKIVGLAAFKIYQSLYQNADSNITHKAYDFQNFIEQGFSFPTQLRSFLDSQPLLIQEHRKKINAFKALLLNGLPNRLETCLAIPNLAYDSVSDLSIYGIELLSTEAKTALGQLNESLSTFSFTYCNDADISKFGVSGSSLKDLAHTIENLFSIYENNALFAHR